jgi:glyoxylase-like metal-dependent hydrolase (beta-lactamase superfamily II)
LDFNVDVELFSIQLGFDQVYLIRSDGLMVVDAGAPGKGKKLLRTMERSGIKPTDLRLVAITHGHWDHIGSAKEIKEHTGAAIALHETDVRWLEEPMTPISPGVTSWGRALSGVMKLFMPLVRIPATGVDIKLGDDDFPLYSY